MSALRLFFLGPARFRRADQDIQLNAAKAVALLGYLAVSGTPQTRDQIAALLWPESLEDAARKNLRNTLWSIRKALGDEVLHAGTERAALADGVWTDVQAFELAVAPDSNGERSSVETLERAVDLYRGPFLDGLSVADAPEFELWLTTTRERLGQQYLRALDGLVAAHRSAGKWERVIAVARRALQYDNLQEPMYRALMEAHARLGRRAEALREYDSLRETLARELSVEPLPESQALRDAVVSGDLQPRSSPVPAGQTSTQRRRETMPAPHRVAAPFVGRRAERAALDEELRRAAAGELRIVLLTGELGIGKTRLWQEWSSTVPASATVLETRCLDTTQSLPFAPLTNLFNRPPCTKELFTRSSLIAPVWLAELTRLFPEIKQEWPDLPAPAALPPEEERRRLFEAFTQVLHAVEDRPLVLYIDDLHWIDRATLDWLVYVSVRMRDEAVLVVAAYRPTDAPAQLARVVAQWSRQNVARRVPLARLNLDETRELLGELGVDVERAADLQTKSTGNPYFLIELSRASANDTPPELIELVRARLDRLPDAARQVVQAAAVLDSGFDFSTLRRTSGRREEETLDALDALLEAGIVREQNGTYEFVHPLVATVVRADMSLARRSFLHRRAAEALEATHSGLLATIAGRLSTHYRHAGRTETAARYAELAAERALELAAPDEAAALYQTALDLDPTPSRRLGLGQARTARGDLDGARTAFREAKQAFEEEGDRVGAAEAALALAYSYLPSGRGDLTVRWARDALSHLDPEEAPAACARAYHLLGAGSLLVDRALADAEAHLLESARLAAEHDLPDLGARSRFELGNLFAQQGNLSKAVDTFAESIALAQTAGDRFQEVLGHNNLAYHALLTQDLTMAREHIERALSLAEEHSLFLPRQYLYSTRGEIALGEGDLDAADTWFERALTEAQRVDNRVQMANLRANHGLVARERGDLDAALLELEAAHRAVTGTTAPHLQIKIALLLAELHLERGETAAATEALSRADERLDGSGREGLKAWADRLRRRLEN